MEPIGSAPAHVADEFSILIDGGSQVPNGHLIEFKALDGQESWPMHDRREDNDSDKECTR